MVTGRESLGGSPELAVVQAWVARVGRVTSCGTWD